MSYSGGGPASGAGGADLDPVNYSDECFPSYISLNSAIGGAQDEVGFEAAPSRKENTGASRKTKNVEIITDVLYYADAETNTKYRKKDAEIQVEKNINLAALGENEDEGYYDEDERIAQKLGQPKVEYDEEALAGWLQTIYPKVSLILETNQKSRTFDNYEVYWEEERADIDLWQKLQTNYDFKEANKALQKALNQMKAAANDTSSVSTTNREDDDDWGNSSVSQSDKGGVRKDAQADQYQVVSVAWSCNGATLAVAYGKTNHDTWCEHHSIVSTWGIFRREFDPKKPNLTIEVQNCLTTIEFHPNDPLILAGGTMNGEIYLWNIDSERKGEEDPMICSSSIDEYYHREAITKLIWMRYESMTSLAFQYCLLSVSTDAKILVWRLNDKLRFPAKGHLLARKKDGELATVGGTSFCKVHGGSQDDQTFIVGTEGGSIFKCSITEPQDKDITHFFEGNTGGLRWKQEAIGLLSNLPSKAIMEVKKRVERYVLDKGGDKDVWAPTVYSAKPDVKMIFSVPFNANYEKHLGPVLGLSSSPFVKRLFLSCSSDGSVRLYDTLGHRPVVTFEPGYNEYLLDVQWSPFRPAVFACVSNHGNVYLYDLSVSKSSPVTTLKDPDLDQVLSNQRVAQTVQFNPKQRDFMAIGYHDGCVRIYQLSYVFSNQKKGEIKVLQGFLEEKGSD